jgi:hypothetical protein
MIQFKYQLRGAGWAAATVANGQTEIIFPASYLCDALRDFVDTVQSLFFTDTAKCIWEEEPGAVQWEFRRRGTRVDVDVRWHDGRDVFGGDDDLLHFALEVNRELERLLTKWGPEGYLKQWRHPFPEEAQGKLMRAIKDERERRRVTK